MCNNYWWSDYGPFKPWSECPTRPDPGAVLLYYLAKRGIQPDEQVAYLMDLLDLQKSMVYLLLRGEGFDLISRCRQLVQALKIHPPLLGIDAKYQQATEIALSALEKSRQIRSRLNRDRIEGLYHQLLDTTFRDKPLLAYLGVKLRAWIVSIASAQA